MSSSVATLVRELSASVSPLLDRKLGCLLGAAVADAASRPMHWVYDLGELNRAVKRDPEHPEFWPQSHSPFYSLPTGENSCYWDEAYAVLKTLNDNNYEKSDSFSLEDLKEKFVEEFGKGSQYDMARRQEYMLKRQRGEVQGPIKGKWLHGGMIKCLENHKKGKEVCGDAYIKETDGFCCSLPLVVKWAGDASLTDLVDEVTKTQSTWSTAVRHSHVASRIVEKFVLGSQDAISEVQAEIETTYPEIFNEIGLIKASLEVNHTKAVGSIFGRPCYNPGSFMGAIHAVETSQTYQEAVRKTILAGGCNCSRSFFIGAMMGAKGGLGAIPIDWVEKTLHAPQILEMALKVLK